MVPTMSRIYRKFVDDFGYQGCRNSLRKEVKKLGFRWRKMRNNKLILMERPPIRHLRIEFLKRMRSYREEGRNIVYMDETYIHSCHTKQKGWSDQSDKGLLKPNSKGPRLIILNAGGENGFVPGAYARWKSTTTSGDYHNDMNYENYEKWIKNQLLPNVPPRSVIVIDNAPYHNKQAQKCPNSTTRKDEMKSWLRLRNIPFPDNSLKPELYNIIKIHKPRYKKIFQIDEIINSMGHDVLRLPPYHPDLNPIENVWAAMKEYVGSRNVKFNLADVTALTDDFFQQFTVDQWRSVCEHSKKFELQFMEREPMMDIVVEELIIRVNGNDSDSSDENDDSDEDDSASSESGLSGIEELDENDCPSTSK